MVFTEKTKGKSDRKQVKDVAAYSLAFMWPALPVASLKNTKLNWEGTSYPSGQKLASLQGKKKGGVNSLAKRRTKEDNFSKNK